MLPPSTVSHLNEGMQVAARLSPCGHLNRWIKVTPFTINPETGMSAPLVRGQPRRYRVRCFGVPQDFDYDTYDLHEEYITTFENIVVFDLEAVESIVSEWLDDLTLFTTPIACNCPR